MTQRGDPRNGAAYRRTCQLILATTDQCHLCGHHGAKTIDHKISRKQWLTTHGTYHGYNHPNNLAPAHGTRGPHQPNPCPVCGLLCNQTKGDNPPPTQPRSRNW
jgi:hypothetical protein